MPTVFAFIRRQANVHLKKEVEAAAQCGTSRTPSVRLLRPLSPPVSPPEHLDTSPEQYVCVCPIWQCTVHRK